MAILKAKKQMGNIALAMTVGSSIVFATNSAWAEPGFYVGGAYGQNSVNDSDFDDKNPAIKIFAGGKFNDYIGLEAAINDYGEAERTGYSAELSGNTLAVVGFLPIMDCCELFIKGGQLWWKDKVEVLDTFSDTLNGNESFYGVGADFNLSESKSSSIALRLEMERYKVELSQNEIGADVDGSSDVDVASVSVLFNF